MQLSLFIAKEVHIFLENVQINFKKNITHTHNNTISEMDFSNVNITSSPIFFRTCKYF